jgi:hypothetical protein
VEGDVAEFGTASGFSALTIAHAMAIFGNMYNNSLKLYGVGPKSLHLFDSFQGLPRPSSPVDLQSPNVTSGRWKAGAFQVLRKDELFALCSAAYNRDKIRIVEGWYSVSLQTIPADVRFAMVHLDCDLYSSTFEVLDHLLAHLHLSDGCRLFFDDWDNNRSSPRFGQRKAWRDAVEKYRIEYSDGGDYAVTGHKFTVHVES